MLSCSTVSLSCLLFRPSLNGLNHLPSFMSAHMDMCPLLRQLNCPRVNVKFSIYVHVYGYIYIFLELFVLTNVK